ncbi:hypothetical protein [Sporisorium scitamineum]|uniref:Uncharacterized protein n=1 Tax=Sporisorium scitamineum TaxID=49012 RepID=A0A0F7S657_9BASI|nr:hypothetical protein [Sporisorium scitamineum]
MACAVESQKGLHCRSDHALPDNGDTLFIVDPNDL